MIVYVIGVPEQPNVAVAVETVIVDVTAELVRFVAVKDGTESFPEAANPIDVVLFDQE